MSEEYVVQNSAPTLAGLKTGNLFTCPYESREQMELEIREFNERLSRFGIFMLPLRYSKERVLLYLFRPHMLEKDLKNRNARKILSREGYTGGTWIRYIQHLVERLNQNGEFPHEIGLFLGYPPEDVQGFIFYHGQNSKIIGCWKVYGDVEAAKKIFAAFRHCTRAFTEYAESGMKLEQLINLPAMS